MLNLQVEKGRNNPCGIETKQAVFANSQKRKIKYNKYIQKDNDKNYFS